LVGIEAIFPSQPDSIHLVTRADSGGEFEFIVMDSKGAVNTRTSVVTPWPDLGRSVFWGHVSEQLLLVIRSGTDKVKAASFVAINCTSGSIVQSGVLDELTEVYCVKSLPKGGCVVVGSSTKSSNGGTVLTYLDKELIKRWSVVDPNEILDRNVALFGEERVCTYFNEKNQLTVYSMGKGLESSTQLEEPPRIVSGLVDDMSNHITLIGREPARRQEARRYGLHGQKLEQIRLSDQVLSRIHPDKPQMCILQDGTLVVSDGYGVLRVDLQKGIVGDYGRPNAETNVLEVGSAILDSSNNLVVLDSRTRLLHTFNERGARIRTCDVGESVSRSEPMFVKLGDNGSGSIALGPLPMNMQGFRVAVLPDCSVQPLKDARLPFFAINTRSRIRVEWIRDEFEVRDTASERVRKFPAFGVQGTVVYDAYPLDDGRVLAVEKELRQDAGGSPENVVRIYESDGSSNSWLKTSGWGAIFIGPSSHFMALHSHSRDPRLVIIANKRVVELAIPGKPMNSNVYRYLVREDKNGESCLLEIDCLGAQVYSYKIGLQQKVTK
jgi:hypothetical protein